MSRDQRGRPPKVDTQMIPSSGAPFAMEATTRIVQRRGLEAHELAALSLAPRAGAGQAGPRSNDDLRPLDDPAEEPARGAIVGAYRGSLQDRETPLLIGPAVDQASLRRFSALMKMVEGLQVGLDAILDSLPTHAVPASQEQSGSRFASWPGWAAIDAVDLLPTEPDGLLGRGRELAEIDACIDATGAEQGSFLVLEGRSGMGKSSLLAEIRRRAAGAGLTICSARGSELEGEFAFGVVRQLFEPAIGALGKRERARLFEGAAAPAEPVLAVGGDPVPDCKFAALHGLYRFAVNLSSRAPLLLAVDDVHWADAPSLRSLAYLLNRLEGLPILVAIATRPPLPGIRDELLVAMLAHPAVRILPIRPL